MRIPKNVAIVVGLVLSVGIIASSATALLLSDYYRQVQFEGFSYLCQEILNKQPEAEQAVLVVLKEYTDKRVTVVDENIMSTFGYQAGYFWNPAQRQTFYLAGIGLLAGVLLFFMVFWLWHRREIFHIRKLTAYLEDVNSGGKGLLLSASENEFSKLQDEIYKTVTTLYQAKETAVAAKNHFAENLANIAHQLKTPITAISLSTQMMENHTGAPIGDAVHTATDYPGQIQRQLKRLTHLEEALLLLSRIDAGTLSLKREAVDVFTVLTLAADNLQELFAQAEVSVAIPEMGEMEIYADLDWTMEAVMNLMKNCMEHTPAGGTVHCSYEQNPLYTQIRIWDEGSGFHKEDIPHLFERFYRGKDAGEGGIGIGLSLTKAIMEMQNSIISAGNRIDGGAFFEIRIYNH